MKLQYSPDAVEKLRDIKRIYGEKCFKNIRSSIKGLSDMPQKGSLVEKYIDIPNPYRFIHVSQHYVFYRIDEKASVTVTDCVTLLYCSLLKKHRHGFSGPFSD